MILKILNEIKRLKGESLNSGYLYALSEIENFILNIDKRKYESPLPEFGDVFTVSEFEDMVKEGLIIDDDGHGYWIKDGKSSRDDVFSSKKEDADGVIWFNK